MWSNGDLEVESRGAGLLDDDRLLSFLLFPPAGCFSFHIFYLQDLSATSRAPTEANPRCLPSHFLQGLGKTMEKWVIVALLLGNLGFLVSGEGAESKSSSSFEENFDIMWAEDHFKTSSDGQVWYLQLDKETGCGFQTKQRYRFGWFSMKLKLVGGDSAGVVTAYYMCSDTGPERDEIDFEFLGNRSGQPYTIQTNVYKSGVGGREMRHILWFDPTEDFHTYSVLWNNAQLVFYVDRVPIRVYKNTGKPNGFFPNEKPMYMYSSIWNADDWATRGGLEKTDWKNAPFVSSYKDFHVDGCQWEDPYPACVSTTTSKWWDQHDAWVLSDSQKEDFAWVLRNLVTYDYCQDKERYPETPEECSLSPWV